MAINLQQAQLDLRNIQEDGLPTEYLNIITSLWWPWMTFPCPDVTPPFEGCKFWRRERQIDFLSTV